MCFTFDSYSFHSSNLDHIYMRISLCFSLLMNADIDAAVDWGRRKSSHTSHESATYRPSFLLPQKELQISSNCRLSTELHHTYCTGNTYLTFPLAYVTFPSLNSYLLERSGAYYSPGTSFTYLPPPSVEPWLNPSELFDMSEVEGVAVPINPRRAPKSRNGCLRCKAKRVGSPGKQLELGQLTFFSSLSVMRHTQNAFNAPGRMLFALATSQNHWYGQQSMKSWWLQPQHPRRLLSQGTRSHR